MADNRLIPIKDESSLAFNELFDRLGTLDLTPLLIYLVDNVNSTALPHLAEQFDVTGNKGWLLTTTDDEKRALIKQSVKIHKLKGTKAAIKNVFNVLNLNGIIQEWFEYGGNPYYFKIFLTFNDSSFDSSSYINLKNMINEYKNIRSVLEELSVESRFSCTPNWATYLDAENEVMVTL